MQQYLPFTVLKPNECDSQCYFLYSVATVLTVYGIETRKYNSKGYSESNRLQQYLPFTVLKLLLLLNNLTNLQVATVLTVYGIYDEYTHKSLVIAFMLENLNQ